MSDLIDRQLVIDGLSELVSRFKFVQGDLGGAVSGVREYIKTLPSAEPEREKGEWIYDTERVAGDGWTYRQYHCSECGFQELGGLANYCPHCGADMTRGGK